LRDAVFSGMTLDTFNRYPEKVEVACCAQLINCLNSLYLAHEDRFCVTPVGHVFAMYAAHQNGQSLRCEFSAPSVHYDRDGKPVSFWALRGSASLHDRQLVVTAVNTNVKDALETQIVVRGARVSSGDATVLSSTDIHARNTFEQRQAVAPKTQHLEIKGDTLTFRFPAASVTKLDLRLT
jgi:alpha-N-arabinofuranosidase